MNALLQHLVVLPILVPMLCAALMLFLPEGRRVARVSLALLSTFIQLSIAIALLYLTSDAAHFIWPEGVGVYAIGNWDAPFGIVLVVDRLSAVMLTLVGIVSFTTLIYAVARWDRPGQPFHSVFQLITMGLNGAFLTGDLFNLFVFFEVLLAASYGLVLRGSGTDRIKYGMHYIVVNLVASLLFLVGVSLIYGVTGTLNMADLAGRAAALPADDRVLFDAGAAVLGIAFLVKAGSWPLNFWLPGAYSITHAPVGSIFALMTKVGLYAILRVGTILGEDETLAAALLYLGLATLITATIAILAAKHLARLVSFSVLVSMGILLAAFGLRIETLTGPIIFYMVVSVLTTSTFFMLTGMTDRTRISDPPVAPEDAPAAASPVYIAYGVRQPSVFHEDEEVGVAIPAVMAFLGLMFVCCSLLIVGLPPLPGFVTKFALLSGALRDSQPGAIAASWIFSAAVLISGLAMLIALSRVGMRLFWSVAARTTPRLRILEAAPVAALVLLCVTLGVAADPVSRYLDSTARSLHEPDTYVRTVLGSRSQAGMEEEP
jgi:multicomponent K+:H+ antiporter subunit D